METNPEVDTEELTARKKSRFKFLKTRFFGRLKRKDTEGQIKQSQSSSDVTMQQSGRGEDASDGSEDDLLYPHGTLSSRALSHDSIFLSEQTQSSKSERVLSQENVHSKIKELQLKLQQQHMRLGPPPLLFPGKRIEDTGTTSEDDGLPCSPPELSLQDAAVHRTAYKFPEAKKHLSSLSLAGTGSEEEEQPLSRPLSPVSRMPPQGFISSATDLTSSPSGVDFSSPAQYVPCLDNSAARHRMSIKPRNQRASTKAKKPPDTYHSQASSMNSLDQLLSEREEEPQSGISTDTIKLHSYSTQVTSLVKELTSISLPPSTSLEGHAMALDWAPPSMDDKVPKSAEPFRFQQGRLTTNPLFLQRGLFLSLSTDNQHTKETAVDCNEVYESSAVKILATDCVTTEKYSESIDADTAEQIQVWKKAVDTDVLKVAMPSARLQPVPAPRMKKPTLENKNMYALKIPDTKYKEFENDPVLPQQYCRNTEPFGDQDESSTGDEKPQRLNSFQFSIASAKNRSRMSSEQVTKNEEERSCDATSVKAPSYNQYLEEQMEKTLNVKPTEVNRNSSATSLLREVILQNVSRTEMERNTELCEGCAQTIEPERNTKVEEYEDKRNLFGVKLRTTSMSLKYRSDMAKPDAKTKRHSLDDHQILGVFEGHTDKEPSSTHTTDITNDGKSNSPTNLALRSPDLQQDATLNKVSDIAQAGSSKETDTGSEPAWMTQEKTKTHQPSSKPYSQPASPLNSTPSSAVIESFAPLPLRMTAQHRPPTTKSQFRTSLSTELQPGIQSTPQTPPKLAVRAMAERQASYSLRPENVNVSQLPKGVDLVEIKLPSKPGGKSNTQIEPDVLRRTLPFMPNAKPEPSSSSSSSLSSSSSSHLHLQSPSDTAQPSWMELAKRKSLAWSDKSLD